MGRLQTPDSRLQVPEEELRARGDGRAVRDAVVQAVRVARERSLIAQCLHEAVDVLVEQRERHQRLGSEVPLDAEIVGGGAERIESRVADGDRTGVARNADRGARRDLTEVRAGHDLRGAETQQQRFAEVVHQVQRRQSVIVLVRGHLFRRDASNVHEAR